MLGKQGSLFLFCFTAIFILCAGDVLVQLNVNRPLYDVNENFVSFSIKPDNLYNALNGPNRVSVTHIATLLGSSYLKFVGNYNFEHNTDIKKRNPSRVIWRGFNRWSRAVNWTLVIPVEYKPDEWEPMDSLNILNNSYMSGISDCIWQFGTDFSLTREKDYVADLRTFDLMLEAFRPYVHKWKIMGADVTAESSLDETNRYVELTRDFNTAFGWNNSIPAKPSTGLNSYRSDIALRTLLAKKVPVWLTLPQQILTKKGKAVALKNSEEELLEGMKLAQVLGDAANTGFDTIFKYITASELETPTFGLYVAAIFKKVMGSRVFPSRPLHFFIPDNKLYTHCANSISGGIAFMVINKEVNPLYMTIGSLVKLRSTEVWQYSLTMENDEVLMNNEKISLNSTMKPQINPKTSSTSMQLTAPALSVTFWVLPGVNLEHCQFVEMEEDIIGNSSEETDRILKKRHSAAEKLISQLIRETKIPQRITPKGNGRSKRFVKSDKKLERAVRSYDYDYAGMGGSGRYYTPTWFDEEAIDRFSHELRKRSMHALDWIQGILDVVRSYDEDRPMRRRIRSVGKDLESEEDTLPKSIKMTVMKKHEHKNTPLVDMDEEIFLKTLDEIIEPKHNQQPAEDVHMGHIDRFDDEDMGSNFDIENSQLTPHNQKFKIDNPVNYYLVPEPDINKQETEKKAKELRSETTKEKAFEWELKDGKTKGRSRRDISPSEDSEENMVLDREFRNPWQQHKRLPKKVIPEQKSMIEITDDSPGSLVTVVTNRVVKFMDVVTQHMNHLYSVFTTDKSNQNNINK